MRKLLLTNSLRAFVLSLGGLALGALQPSTVSAQCTFDNNQYPFGDVATPTAFNTPVQIAGCNYAGEYGSLTGFTAGNIYTFSATDFSTGYATVYDASNVPVAFGALPLSFTPATSGDYKVQWNTDAGCGTDSDCHITSVTMSPPPPATPATPIQDPGSPTCTSGTTLSVSGAPGANEQWYWQTTASGTSTSTPFNGTYTVFANGTYYLRAFSTLYSLWSINSSSVDVTNFPTATAPSAPIAAANPACGSTTLSMPTPPAGTEYYWQTVFNGSSTANNASTPLTVTATGTYYVAAYETASQCWSTTPSILVTIDNFTPVAPIATATDVNVCIGGTSAILEAAPGATAGTATLTFGTNYTLTPGQTQTLTQALNLPAGATVTSSTLTFSDVTTTSATYPTDIDVSMNGSATLATADLAVVYNTVTNAGPYTHNPTVNGSGNLNLVLAHTYSFGGPATFGNITMTVNYIVPPSVLTWSDAASNGSVLGTGATLEAVGTTVLPNTSAAGVHSFYVTSVAGGCTSPATEVQVHVTPVLATLNPVNVTCNGGANGSFTLGTVQCGSGNFTYSVNGGAFGPIPTNLTAGTYSVVIQDGAMQSAPISVVLTEPGAPQSLSATDVTYYNATLSWTAQGSETSWTVIYGPAGFNPATGGTVVSNATNPYTINGSLSVNTNYEFYVFANCGATADTAGPLAFATDPGFFTTDNACGPGFIDISATGTPLNLADQGSSTVTAGFPLVIQGVSSNQVTVSNNGWVQVGSSTLNVWNIDLDGTAGNVYYQTTNVNGEDLFIVQWDNRPRWIGVAGQTVTFELIYNGTTNEFYYVYDDVVFGGTQSGNDYGAQGTISVDGPVTDITLSNYSSVYLTNNSCAHFYNALCPNPTGLTAISYTDEIDLDWTTGLYGEVDWTIIYGPTGFDPTTEGTTITANSSDAAISSLTQQTTYDFYIYSECAADNLTSPGLLGTFTTLPLCADPTNLTATTDVDSLEAGWNFVANPSYDAIDYNIKYGLTGFDVNAATAHAVGTANLYDTIMDASFLGGGVYQMYVQAVCADGFHSNYAGPFTFVMPLSNDTVCGAENLNVNGSVYTFNNNGATVSLNEASIAPPATGAQTTTGWSNSTLNNTTWFTFQAPATGSIRINNTSLSYNGQVAVYEATNCGSYSSFELVAANDNEIGGSSVAPNFTICGLTPGATYYLMHDGFNNTTGNYTISIHAIDLNAGTATPVVNVCTGTVVDLYSSVTGNDAGGVWSNPMPSVTANMNGSSFNTTDLAFTTFNFQYRVTDGCAYDSVITHVHVFGPSSAGQDGTITICRNEPFDLLSGLDGTADLNGTWYNPSNQVMPSSSVEVGTLTIPGLYNYDYIAGNGVCPNDTANVVVNVSASCNFIGLEEQVFESVSLYPNPSQGTVFISSDATGAFDYAVTDAEGRVITEVKGGIKAAKTTEINLNNVQTGVYFIRLTNGQAEKVFRVVIQ